MMHHARDLALNVQVGSGVAVAPLPHGVHAALLGPVTVDSEGVPSSVQGRPQSNTVAPVNRH